MHIKSQSVIPPGTKITRLPPSAGKVKSLYSLEKAQEAALQRQAENAQREARFKEALAKGMSIAEAAIYAMG